MTFVAIAALDFAALGGFLDFDPREVGPLVVAALSTPNVMLASILIGLVYPDTRPFLLGFVAFGAVALAFYIALERSYDPEAVPVYLSPMTRTLEKTIGRDWPIVFFPVLYIACI